MKPEKKDIVYNGLGFPVILRNCPIKEIRGAESPDINLNELMKNVFEVLIFKDAPINGSEIRFIRTYLEMSQKEFASFLNHGTHSIVSAWEKKQGDYAGLDKNTEIILRQKMALKVLNNLSVNDLKKICATDYKKTKSQHSIELRVA